MNNKSEITNVTSLKGISIYLFISLTLFFLIRLIKSILMEKYIFTALNLIGVMIPPFLIMTLKIDKNLTDLFLKLIYCLAAITIVILSCFDIIE